MKGEHKSYGYEGGYRDWTADKVFKNMRIMQDGKQIADVEETEDVGLSRGGEGYTSEDRDNDISYSQRQANREREWEDRYRDSTRPTSKEDIEREDR